MDQKDSQPPKKTDKKPPEMSPYLFPFLLAVFGLWCFYDGWITSNPEMQEHALFNRIVSLVLLPWSIYDYLKVKKHEKLRAADDRSAGKEAAP